MRQGMRDASPSAELISWLYMPQPAPLADWVYELPRHTPEGVILQFNFESGGCKNQLGHPRCGGDYWLSYVGSSDHFGCIAAGAAGSDTELRIDTKTKSHFLLPGSLCSWHDGVVPLSKRIVVDHG